ncbi:MAG: hypothetical protein R3F56_24055 [Planctomycetota bacterium]
MLALAVMSIGSCGENPDVAATEMTTRRVDAKSDCESLLSALMPFAKQMLSKHGEFFPFGGTMSTSGEITQSAAGTGEERPPSQALMNMLRAGFRAAAERGEIRAAAIVYDTLVVPPGKTSKQDAVTVALDHRDDYSVVVVFPYSRLADGTVHLDSPFASQGSGEVFVR